MTFDGDREEAFAGEAITLVLTDEIDISRGDLLLAADEALPAVQSASVDVVWMAEQPLSPGQSYDIIRAVSDRCTTAYFHFAKPRCRLPAQRAAQSEYPDCQVTVRRTEKRKFIIADTPGHEQYTRNMATGASTCELAILLIDARKGVLDQTRRHSFISTLLGIKHLVVAINKMDLVDYSEETFTRIREDYLTFAEQLPGNLDIRFVPRAQLAGRPPAEPDPVFRPGCRDAYCRYAAMRADLRRFGGYRAAGDQSGYFCRHRRYHRSENAAGFYVVAQSSRLRRRLH